MFINVPVTANKTVRSIQDCSILHGDFWVPNTRPERGILMLSALIPLKNEVYSCRTRDIHLQRACFGSWIKERGIFMCGVLVAACFGSWIKERGILMHSALVP